MSNASDEFTRSRNVHHPDHYNSHPSGIEAWELCEQLSFCAGCAVKYLFRLGLKGDPVEDLEKSQFYLQKELARIQALRTEAKGDDTHPLQMFYARRILLAEEMRYLDSEDVAHAVCEVYETRNLPKDPLLVVLSNLYDRGVSPRFGRPLEDRLWAAERQLEGFIADGKKIKKRGAK